MPRPLYRTKRRERHRKLKEFALCLAALQLWAGGVDAQIVADGHSATSVSAGAGGITDIRTATISAGHGVNTFAQFSTAAGSVTHVHVPVGAVGTVNIVNGPASVIAGAVHSMQGGEVGGALYFANPAGVVVGPTGSIVAGRVSLSTPAQDFAGAVVRGGQVSDAGLRAIIDGEAPQSAADISVAGQVQGHSAVWIRAGGDIVISGAVRAGSRAGRMTAAVNTGSIDLNAGGSVILAAGGSVVAGAAGGGGGDIRLRAGSGVSVGRDAVLLAEGEGAGHGGVIDVFAGDTALIAPGGLVSVAAHGTGDGGFVEYSAARVVAVEGALRAWSVGGRGGTIFIDPEELILTGAVTGGANFQAEATLRITVAANAVISTRNTDDPTPAAQATAMSRGDSGSIELRAPNVALMTGSQLLAHADNGFQSGDITIIASRVDGDGHLTEALPVSSTSVLIDRAYLHARRIVISAETVKDNTVAAEDSINAYLSGLIPDGMPDALAAQLVELGESVASNAQAALDAVNYENWPSYLSAQAEIGIRRSVLRAEENIRIASAAVAQTQITPETGGMALVIAASNTVARSIVWDTRITAGGDVSVTADTRTDHALSAEGVPGGGLSGLNTAIVASVRMGGAEAVLGGSPNRSGVNRPLLPAGVSLGLIDTVTTGGAVAVQATNTTDLALAADTRLGENGRGAAVVLSLDDRSAIAAVDGQFRTNTFEFDIAARNIYRLVDIAARVTGGALVADDAPTDSQPGQPDATQDVGAALLAGVATAADDASGVGEGAGITAATQGGDVSDRAYAAAFALSAHNATARVFVGDREHVIALPTGGTGLPGSGFWSDMIVTFVPGTDPSLPNSAFAPVEDGYRITAENVLQSVRQVAITAAGEIPAADPGEGAGDGGDGSGDGDDGPAAKRTALVSVSLADWDLDAQVFLGGREAGFNSLLAPAGLTVTARNTAPDIANRGDLDQAHALYSGRRQAEDPPSEADSAALAELAAATEDDGAGAGPGPGGGMFGGGAGGAGGGGEGDGEGDGAGDDTGEAADAPNAGGLIGAWSDGEGPLFARSDGTTRALSVAQTFAAGEALGIGVSLARLSGAQTARITQRPATYISVIPNPFQVDDSAAADGGAVRLRALQAGAWGASAGAPDDPGGATLGATEGGAYGASIALVNLRAVTETLLEAGASIQSTGTDHGALILARDNRLVSADARTHGAAGQTAFTGALSIVQRRDVTRAMAAPWASFDLAGTLSIRAVNRGDTVTVVSAGAVGQRSIGVGIALTFADRETVAGLVDADRLDGRRSFFGPPEALLGGLTIEAVNAGNVITGGRTSAGEAPTDEAPAGEPGGTDPAPEPDPPGEDAPVALDAEVVGDDSQRIADAIGGSNPLSGGGGGDDEGGMSFAGDFGAIFADVTTEALVLQRETNPDLRHAPIRVDVEGAVTIASQTAISYGQSSAVTAVATGGIGISGSFGLTWIDHATATRMVNSEIEFAGHFVDSGASLRETRITSADESRFDLLVDGRAGRPDGGWAISIAANFARVASSAETELSRGVIRLGTATLREGADPDGSLAREGWFWSAGDGEGGWYNDESTGLWRWTEDEGGWSYSPESGWVHNDRGPGYLYLGEDGGIGTPPSLTGPLSPDGRQITVTALADPRLTIRATSERTGPAAPTDGGSNGGSDDGQMDAVGDLVRDSGTAASQTEAQSQNGGESQGLRGISITVAPLRLIADASVILENSLIEAQQLRDNPDATGGDDLHLIGAPGLVTVRARARTDLDIDASSDAIAAAIAITDTLSRVRVSRSDIDLRGTGRLEMTSEADERHRMRATAGAARAIKAAGILSLRTVDNRLTIDADESLVPSWRTDGRTAVFSRFTVGGGGTIAAHTTHDLDFEVLAGDGSTAALALAGIISLADTVTELAAGVVLFNDREMLLEATNTYTRYRAVAVAAAGSLVPGAQSPDAPEPPAGTDTGEPYTGHGAGGISGALLDVADSTEEAVREDDAASDDTDGTDGGDEAATPPPPASRKASFAIAFTLDRHDDTTTIRAAAPRLDPDDGALIIGGFTSTGWVGHSDGVTLNARTTVERLRKSAHAGIGLGEAAPDRGAVVAVNLGDWRLVTDAMLGDDALRNVQGRTVTVSATTSLPEMAPALQRGTWLSGRDTLFDSGGGGFAEGEDLPESSDTLLRSRDWNIQSAAQSDFGKLGLAVDGSITRLRTRTEAVVAAGPPIGATELLAVRAETTGGLATRRDAQGLVPVESGGSGAGGSGHVLLLRPETLAQFGVTPAGTAPHGSIGAVEVVARNALVGAAASSSFGKAEGFGLNIAFSMVDYDGSAIARLINPRQVTLGAVTVRAEDVSVLLADAGSSAAGNVSIGVSAALIFGDRRVLAEISGTGAGDLQMGATSVTAHLGGAAVATSQAGAGGDDDADEDGSTGGTDTPGDDPPEETPQTRDETPLPRQFLGARADSHADELGNQEADTQSDETEGQGGDSVATGGSFGFALAGDFSGLFGRQEATARVSLATPATLSGALDISATTDTALFAAAGSAVGGAGAVGIAASAALNFTRRSTTAELIATDLTLGAGPVRVTGTDRSDIRLLAAGRGGAAVTVAVLGSAAIDFGRVDVAALADVDRLVTGGIVAVAALNSSDTLMLAGALKAAPESEADPETDPDGESATDPDDAEETDGDVATSGVGIGIGFAGRFASETVTATLRGAYDGHDISVNARRTGTVDAVAASAGAADTFSLAGAASVVVIDRSVRAVIDGATITAADEASAVAHDSADSRLRVGSESESDTVSIGGAAAILVERRRTEALVTGSAVNSSGADMPRLIVVARTDGDADILQTGAGEASDDGFSATIGVGALYATRTTRAEIVDSFVQIDHIEVQADQGGSLRNRQGSTNQGGVAGSLGVIATRLVSDVAARLDNTTVWSGTDTVTVHADERTRLLSRSAKTGEGGVAIDIMVATAMLRGSLVAEVAGGYMGANTLSVRARDITTVQAAAIARAETSGFGGTGGVAYAANRLDVLARLTGPMGALAGGVTVRAETRAELTGTVVGLSISDGFSGSIQVAWLTLNRDVQALVQADAPDLAGDLTIEARREDVLVGIGATAAAGSSVGIAGNVLQTGGRTLAEARLTGAARVRGDVSITAQDASQAFNLAVGAAASGGGFSAVGSMAYVQMGRRPADAVPTEINDRSQQQEAALEDNRDALGDEFAGAARLDAADLRRRFDLATEARLVLEAGAALETGGDVTVAVADNRRVTALAGQLQISFNMGGLAEEAIRTPEIDENGLQVDLGEVIGQGEATLMSLNLRGGGGDDESGIGEASAQVEPPTDPVDPGEGGTGGDTGGGIPDPDGDGEDAGSSGGVAVGASLGWARLGGLVSAEIVLASGASLDVGGTLAVGAFNAARAAGVSVGAQAGADVGLGAGAGIARHDQLVRARILGAGPGARNAVTVGDVALSAASDGRAWGIAGLVVQASGVAGGATLAVADLDAHTEAVAQSVRLVSSQDVSLTSRDDSRSMVLALTGGAATGGGGVAVTISVGVNTAHSTTRALLRDAQVQAGRDLILRTDRAQRMTSLVLQVAAGGTVGAGGALAIATQRGSSAAELIDAAVEVGRNVDLRALGASQLSGAAVGAAGGGSAAVSGSVSIITKEDEARARVHGSTVMADGSVLVQAVQGGSMGGVGGGDAAMLEDVNTADTRFGDLDVATEQPESGTGGSGAGSGAVAVGGAVGIGASVAILTTRATVVAEITDSRVEASGQASVAGAIARYAGDATFGARTTTTRGGVHVVADNLTEVRALAITAGVGGTVGIAVQVPVLLLRDAVSARIADSSITASGSLRHIAVESYNQTDILTFSAVAGAGGSVGVGALVEVGSLRKSTLAEVVDSTLQAGGDVRVFAVAPELLRKRSIAIGVGGFVGVAGVVESLVSENVTLATIRGTTVSDARDVLVLAQSPRRIEHVSGTVAGAGGVAVGGAVLVLKGRDITVAELARDEDPLPGEDAAADGWREFVRPGGGFIEGVLDGEPDAPGDLGPIGGIGALPGAQPQTIAARREVTIAASSDLAVNTTIAGASVGGLVGVGGSILVTFFEQTLISRVGEGVVIGGAAPADRPERINVLANQNFDQNVFLGQITGGTVGIGASVAVLSARSTVLAQVADTAVLRATQAVEVRADAARDLDAVAITAGGAALVGLSASVLVASFSASADDGESREAIEHLGERQDDRDTFEVVERQPRAAGGFVEVREGRSIGDDDSQMAALLAEASDARGVIDFGQLYADVQSDPDVQADTVRVIVGRNVLIEAPGVVIRAHEGGDIRMRAGAVTVAGGVALSAGVSTLNRGTNLQVRLRTGTVIRGQNVVIEADVTSNDGNVQAFAGAGGLVSLSGAVAVTNIRRLVTVSLAGATLEGTAVTIAAREASTARARTLAGSIGALAVGITVARTVRDSLLRVALGNSTVSAIDMTVAAERLGAMESLGVAAAGGVAAGAGVFNTVIDRSQATVDLGTADLFGLDSITVQARNIGAVEADSVGATGSVAGDHSTIRATALRDAVARILGAGVHLAGEGLIRLTAEDAAAMDDAGASSVLARAHVGSVSIGGSSTAATADATNTTVVNVDVTIARLDAPAAQLVIESRTNSGAVSDASAVSAAGVSRGVTRSSATLESTAITRVQLNSSITVDSVSLLANGRDRSAASAVVGRGAFGVIDAAIATLGVTPTTEVILRGTGTIMARDRVDIAALRDSRFDSLIDTTRLAALNVGRGLLETDVTARLRVLIEPDITAPTVAIDATQHLQRQPDAFTGRAVSGLVLDVPSLLSVTNVDYRSEIALVGATLRDSSDARIAGEGIALNVFNDVALRDVLRDDSLGLVASFPRARAELTVTGDSIISLRDLSLASRSAGIESAGDIVLGNRNDIDARTEVTVMANGPEGFPSGRAITDVTVSPLIELRGGATLSSARGDVRLLAGRDQTGRQNIAAVAELRAWNNVASPLSRAMVDAEASATIAPRIDIGSGAIITAARDAVLISDAGNREVWGFFAVHRWQGQDALEDLLGVDIGDVPINREGGDSTLIRNEVVHVDGIVRAGAYANQSITIDRGLNVTREGAAAQDVRVTVDEGGLRNAALAAFVAAREAALADLADAESVDALALRARLEAEIDSLRAQLELLGGPDATGTVISISPLFATGGNIDIRAGAVSGVGRLVARGDAGISVLNESAASLRIEGARIPFRPGGEIRVNSLAVRNNDQIGQQASDGPAPTLSQITAVSSDANPPLISLRGTHVELDGGLPADLIVAGDVENLTGSIEITTLDGSVLVLGAEIAGRSVVINSGGDFLLSAGPGVISPMRDPAGLYRSFFATREDMSDAAYQGYLRSLGINRPSIYSNVVADAAWNSFVANNPDWTIDTLTPGRIRALGNVYIYADTLNIDGIIQSGETDWSLTIHQTLRQRVEALTGAEIGGRDRILLFDPNSTVSQIGREMTVDMQPLGPGGALLPVAVPLIQGNASVWYNVAEGTLEVDPMLTRGGYIELVGRIISTGGPGAGGTAELRSAHGFGRVSIDNRADLPLVLSAVSTGINAVEGVIRIVDTGDQISAALPGVFRETLYRMDGSTVLRQRTELLVGAGVPSTVVVTTVLDPATARFQIAQDYALEFTRLREITRTTTEREIRTIVLGIPWNSQTGERETLPEFVELDEAERIAIATLVTNPLAADLDAQPYTYRREIIGETISTGAWFFTGEQESAPLGRRETWARETVREYRQLDTHQIAANRPIDIRFAGHDTGRVEISSVGDLRIAGGFQNTSGPTTLNSQGAVLATSDTALVSVARLDITAGGDIAGATLRTPRPLGLADGFGGTAVFEMTGLDTARRATRLFIPEAVRTDTRMLMIDQPGGGSVTAQSAGGVVHIGAVSGDIRVGAIAGREVLLEAPESILRAGPASAGISADRVELVAVSGSIGQLGTPLQVVVQNRLDASAQGNIVLHGGAGAASLPLGLVASRAGSVVLTSVAHITDANPDETLDLRAIAGLLEALWGELALRATDEGAAARREVLLASALTEERDAYEFYWSQRRFPAGDGFGVIDRGYDPDFAWQFSQAQTEQLLAEGLTLAQISADADQRTADYHRIHAAWGDRPYDPSVLRLDEATIAQRTGAAFFSDAQLRRGLREDLLLPVTDTALRIEAPNIIARDASLIVPGRIGDILDPLTIAAGVPLDEAALLALWSAARDDLTVLSDGSIRIRRIEDVDVDLDGTLTATAGTILAIGSERDLRLIDVSSGGALRLQTSASILDGRREDQRDSDQIVGRSIVLEAGAGSLGRADVPLWVRTVGFQPSLDARAAQGIWLTGSNDLTLGSVFTPQHLSVVLPAGNLDAVSGLAGPNLRAGSVLFHISGSVGASGSQTGAPLIAAALDGDLTVELGATALALDIAEGTSLSLSMLRGSMVNPLADITIGGPGTLELSEPLRAVGDIVLSPGRLLNDAWVIESANGDLEIVLPRGLTLGGLARLNAPAGSVRLTLNGDLVLQGRIAAREDVSLQIAGAVQGHGATPQISAGALSIQSGGQVGGAPGLGLRTAVGTLQATVSEGDLAVSNDGALRLGPVSLMRGGTLQVTATGDLQLDGMHAVLPDGVMILSSGGAITGETGPVAARVLLRAMEGIGGASPLLLDLREVGQFDAATEGGDLWLTVRAGDLVSDLLTAPHGTVAITAEGNVDVETLGSLSDPVIGARGSVRIGSWGARDRDLAAQADIVDLLASALFGETAVPGRDRPEDPDPTDPVDPDPTDPVDPDPTDPDPTDPVDPDPTDPVDPDPTDPTDPDPTDPVDPDPTDPVDPDPTDPTDPDPTDPADPDPTDPTDPDPTDPVDPDPTDPVDPDPTDPVDPDPTDPTDPDPTDPVDPVPTDPVDPDPTDPVDPDPTDPVDPDPTDPVDPDPTDPVDPVPTDPVDPDPTDPVDPDPTDPVDPDPTDPVDPDPTDPVDPDPTDPVDPDPTDPVDPDPTDPVDPDPTDPVDPDPKDPVDQDERRADPPARNADGEPDERGRDARGNGDRRDTGRPGTAPVEFRNDSGIGREERDPRDEREQDARRDEEEDGEEDGDDERREDREDERR